MLSCAPLTTCAHIIGSAGTPCGRFPDATVASLAIDALDAALADAAIDPERVDAIFFANALAGLMTGQECVRGQVALRHSRYGGIPTVNVENACASGTTGAGIAVRAFVASRALTRPSGRAGACSYGACVRCRSAREAVKRLDNEANAMASSTAAAAKNGPIQRTRRGRA